MKCLRIRKGGTHLTRLAVTHCLYLAFIAGSTYLGLTYYRPFHIAAESFSSFIAFSILILALNTYELSKNIPFLFIGVACGVAGGFNIIHIVASNGMGFFQGDTTNLSMTLSIVQRYIIIVSTLACYLLFYKYHKKIRPFTIVVSFSAISAVLIWIYLCGKFPASYIPGYGVTAFKTAGEYLISAITLVCVIILLKNRKYLDRNVFILLQLYMYSIVLCNVLLTFYVDQQEITNVLAHVFKVFSFYCIYKAIVKVGLKTPYKLLFNELNYKESSLKIKDSELKHTVNELQKEYKLRKNIEEMLIKNEASYKLLIENSRDAILIYNDEKIVFANEGASTLIGLDKPWMLLGQPAYEFFKLSSQKALKDTISTAYETQVIRVDGGVTPVEVSDAYIIYDNKPATLSLIRDISFNKQIEKMRKVAEEDKKLLNETLEFNRMITEFFSNISHELRTPLNVVLSALQVLELEERRITDEGSSEKRRRYVETMKQNCYRLLRLINNLIDISKIDSGYIKPQLQNHDIVSVVEDITLSVAEYVEDKGIKFVFDTNVEEKIIACDPEKIERIMLNLISNAVKFTEQGDLIQVVVLDDDDFVEISVKDTGMGIPEDKLQVVFERFRQVDSTLSRNHEGSGIGLSLVKGLAEMHGGSVHVKSSLGEGSEFIVKLPVITIKDTAWVENNIFYNNNKEKITIEFSEIYS
jgi:PAS domain S-box-containing protein